MRRPLPSRLLSTARRLGANRGAAVFAVVTIGACVAGVAQAHPFTRTLPAEPTEDRLEGFDVTPAVGAAELHVAGTGYAIWADPDSAVVSLASADGRVYTSLPLCALAGRAAIPSGAHAHTTLTGHVLTTTMVAADGTVLSQATLTPSPSSFTVSFTAPLGPQRALAPSFFADGHRGLDMTTIQDGYTPDPRATSVSPAPVVSTVGRTPFAPPPLQVQLRGTPGWMGLGLVQVPSATSMRVGHDGAVSIDYPLASVDATADLGAGTGQAGMLRFPDFVVTFAADPLTGLRAYHDALVGLKAVTVASPPGSRPAWWSEPIVDTWGEQMAVHAFRGSPAFTADWVRSFAADWKARYHVDHFTLVIDSRWQERIGDPMPDPLRFGGVAGMRALIDELHAQGLHVLLWWPMWAHRIDTIPLSAKLARTATPERLIDPTTTSFQSEMAATVGALVGSGGDALAADGLKLDWQYNIPATVSNPARGYGALALYRYMDAIHSSAHRLRPDAMIDASAAAPQFAAVADTLRLYDAWSTAEWDRRAALVAAVNPDMLIDGDGWQVDATTVIPHTVASTVYGTPAMYFGKTWVGGLPITPALTDQLGAVVSLSSIKGQGHPVPLAGGEWQYEVGKAVTARTFAHAHALVVRAPACAQNWHGTVTSTVPGRLLVPMAGSRLVSAVDSAGHRVAAQLVAQGVMLTLRAGAVYQLNFAGGC
ncbi:MAG TPA: hypothetical protein VGQ42_14660 [Candidatus Dormibacteraeota bacterium]|jgi:hypothetical protein|nr:hypothetical protein [Candidatus Dormibacteraeota bacterium]